jgi:hypothetical protein
VQEMTWWDIQTSSPSGDLRAHHIDGHALSDLARQLRQHLGLEAPDHNLHGAVIILL